MLTVLHVIRLSKSSLFLRSMKMPFRIDSAVWTEDVELYRQRHVRIGLFKGGVGGSFRLITERATQFELHFSLAPQRTHLV